MHLISIIIPTRNEEENIAPLLSYFNSSSKNLNYETIVVDDSTDRTADIARKNGAIVVRGKGQGLASAVIDGIKASRGDYIIVMDADLQHPPELVPKIVEALYTNELVIASRYCEGGSIGKEWSFLRKLISRVTNSEPYFLIPRIKDRMSGYFGFRKEILEENLDKLNLYGYKIGLEIMVKGNYKTFIEIPYTFQPRYAGVSKLAKFRLMKDFLTQLILLYFYKLRFLRFTTVGASGIIVNLGTLYLIETFILHKAFTTYWGTTVADKSYLAAFIPAFLLSVVSNFCLNSLWTFSDRTTSKVGFSKYLLVASITLPLDLAILYTLTEVFGLYYIISAIVAIMVVFVIRYSTSKHWVWGTKK